jgi:hypothetical protein
MKLNLGCGKYYKKGFVNIDAYDSTVADRIMPVENLDILSNSVDEIHACQILEHLGYINSIYALAEWFRVLKPKGKLLIETPDIETSFTEYLNGDHQTRKDLLSWIFGVESPGMHHLLCFPEILLTDLLKKSGFTDIKNSLLALEKNHPILQITCKKSKNKKPHQIIAEYRKKLHSFHLVVTTNNSIIEEQEKLIEYFLLKIKQFEKKNDFAIFDEIVLHGCIHSAEMTQLFLKEWVNHKIIPKEKVKIHLTLLDFLVLLHFTDLLFYLIKKSPPTAGKQNHTVQTISNFAKHSIQKLVTQEKESSTIKTSLVKLSKNYTCGENIIFSEKILADKAADLCYKALKEFSLEKYSTAISILKEAIRFERNNLLYYWNLGRLSMINKAVSEAKIFYNDAIGLVQASDFKEKENLKKLLQMEKEHFSFQKYGKPKYDVVL